MSADTEATTEIKRLRAENICLKSDLDRAQGELEVLRKATRPWASLPSFKHPSDMETADAEDDLLRRAAVVETPPGPTSASGIPVLASGRMDEQPVWVTYNGDPDFPLCDTYQGSGGDCLNCDWPKSEHAVETETGDG